ncbi:hypothetical protein [Xenorhabdus nematophila]|nr:conserved hypothetical protein [Xenorhabdus nematophila str. Anatoliense]CEF32483.1 conserved hypothetical protein [Xenorhabdus nematophila str. Websteri]
MALLGAGFELGEGVNCLRREDGLCDAGSMVLGAGFVQPGCTRTNF